MKLVKLLQCCLRCEHGVALQGQPICNSPVGLQVRQLRCHTRAHQCQVFNFVWMPTTIKDLMMPWYKILSSTTILKLIVQLYNTQENIEITLQAYRLVLWHLLLPQMDGHRWPHIFKRWSQLTVCQTHRNSTIMFRVLRSREETCSCPYYRKYRHSIRNYLNYVTAIRMKWLII